MDAEQLVALTVKIFDELNDINEKLGLEKYDIGMTRPESIGIQEQKQLFLEFVDWYNALPMSSEEIYKYVMKNYPISKYPKILCIGDGAKCHLGRKLAAQGYQVCSVDTKAEKKNFQGWIPRADGREDLNEGKLHIIKREFSKEKNHMIAWTNLIVGNKVPMYVEDLISIEKPSVFTIGTNIESHNIIFKEIPIHSTEQFKKEILNCSNVMAKTINQTFLGDGVNTIFIHDKKVREEKTF